MAVIGRSQLSGPARRPEAAVVGPKRSQANSSPLTSLRRESAARVRAQRNSPDHAPSIQAISAGRGVPSLARMRSRPSAAGSMD